MNTARTRFRTLCRGPARRRVARATMHGQTLLPTISLSVRRDGKRVHSRYVVVRLVFWPERPPMWYLPEARSFVDKIRGGIFIRYPVLARFPRRRWPMAILPLGDWHFGEHRFHIGSSETASDDSLASIAHARTDGPIYDPRLRGSGARCGKRYPWPNARRRTSVCRGCGFHYSLWRLVLYSTTPPARFSADGD